MSSDNRTIESIENTLYEQLCELNSYEQLCELNSVVGVRVSPYSNEIWYSGFGISIISNDFAMTTDRLDLRSALRIWIEDWKCVAVKAIAFNYNGQIYEQIIWKNEDHPEYLDYIASESL